MFFPFVHKIIAVQRFVGGAAKAARRKHHGAAAQAQHTFLGDKANTRHRKAGQQGPFCRRAAGHQPQPCAGRRICLGGSGEPLLRGPRSGQPRLGIRVADDEHRQTGDGVAQVAAGVRCRPQPDGLAAELELQPAVFIGAPAASEAAGQVPLRRSRRPTAPIEAAAKRADTPSGWPYPPPRAGAQNASSTAPARAIFSAAYQQAAVTSRRLLRQPKAAAVMASAVVIL